MTKVDKELSFWNAFLIKMQGIFGDFGFTRDGGGESMNISTASSP